MTLTPLQQQKNRERERGREEDGGRVSWHENKKNITGMQLMKSNKKLHSSNTRDIIVSWTKGLI